MIQLQELEQKIRQAIPELKEEWEIFEDGSIDRDMITQVALNHVLEYASILDKFISIHWDGDVLFNMRSIGIWDLKSPYLKYQSPELIEFLNELK
jgi:hypothetical protein